MNNNSDIKPSNVITCEACKVTLEVSDFQKHLLDVHGIGAIKGTKSMVSHIDAEKWFSYEYEYVLDSGLKFNQHIVVSRSEGKQMYK